MQGQGRPKASIGQALGRTRHRWQGHGSCGWVLLRTPPPPTIAAALPAAVEEEAPFCRICHEPAGERREGGQLLSPCACSGRWAGRWRGRCGSAECRRWPAGAGEALPALQLLGSAHAQSPPRPPARRAQAPAATCTSAAWRGGASTRQTRRPAACAAWPTASPAAPRPPRAAPAPPSAAGGSAACPAARALLANALLPGSICAQPMLAQRRHAAEGSTLLTCTQCLPHLRPRPHPAVPPTCWSMSSPAPRCCWEGGRPYRARGAGASAAMRSRGRSAGAGGCT